MPAKIQIKRIYEPPKRSDGLRVLIDRIWPRGLRKDQAKIDLWLKDIAPSTELRRWFGHEPSRWSGFRVKYRKELAANRATLKTFQKTAKGKTLTLLYGARDSAHNNAVVLVEFLAGLDED